jgi:hypothetical protein
MKTLINWLMPACFLFAAVLTTLSLPAHATPTLSPGEAADLQFMREEEKLAHDVYAALYDQWQTPVFLNIRQSEATHTASIRSLLDGFGIPDPASRLGAGEFSNPGLATLYQQLVDEGKQSLNAALAVGRKIEVLDIRDLEERMARTQHPDILRTYANLKRASENHLQAFSGNSQRR